MNNRASGITMKVTGGDACARRACAANEYECCRANFKDADDLGLDGVPCTCACHGVWLSESPLVDVRGNVSVIHGGM